MTTVSDDLRLPSFEDVRMASTRIAGIAHRTPVLTSRTADAATGGTLYFKAENLQRAGAFKFRGAYNAIAALDPESRKRGVIAFSSGNHAQAISYAASLQGAPSTIVMPTDAPAIKVAATRAYGATVVFYDRYKEDRAAIGRRISDETGGALVPPYDHPDVIAGQGTAALELIEGSAHSTCWSRRSAVAGCSPDRRSPCGRCRRDVLSSASSRKPATTDNSRSPRARWSAFRYRSPSPTGR